MSHDIERAQHALRYVESTAGAEAAYRLGDMMLESRQLEIRNHMPGDPAIYGRDPHERFVQCIADIPDAVAAKQAMSHQPWNETELQEAVQHEVNRMAYRLNLEIQDRFTYYLNSHYHRRVMKLAEQNGLSEEVMEKLEDTTRTKVAWAEYLKETNDPTASNIEKVTSQAVLETGIRNAIERRDEAAILDLLEPITSWEAMREKKAKYLHEVEPDTLNAIQQAMDAATRWDDDAIRDGASDYHFKLSELQYRPSNTDRLVWLAQSRLDQQPDAAERKDYVGDCVTRAINEVNGGGQYGQFWNEITQQVKNSYPEQDADQGIRAGLYQPVYEAHGLHKVLDAGEIMDHVMRKHLDLREIPELLNPLFKDPGKPLSFVAITDGHAVAVVNGTVHDSWDSRNMADHTRYAAEGNLVELWLKCDNPTTLEAVHDTFRRYEKARQYDDPLTYGRRNRNRVTT